MTRETSISPTLQAGAAAVELSVLLPVLLLIVFGCIDFGRIAYFSVALGNAVSVGATQGATHRFTSYSAPAWEMRVRRAVSEEMQYVPDFDPGLLTIDVRAASDADENVYVTVDGQYPFTTVVDWPGLPSTVVLERRLTAVQFR